MVIFTKPGRLLLSLLMLLLFTNTADAVRLKRKRHSEKAKSVENASDVRPAEVEGELPPSISNDSLALSDTSSEGGSPKQGGSPGGSPGRGARQRARREAREKGEALQLFDLNGQEIPHSRAFHAHSILRVSKTSDGKPPFEYFRLEYYRATVEWKKVNGFEDAGDDWEIARMDTHGAYTASDVQGHPIHFPSTKIAPERKSKSPGQQVGRFLTDLEDKVEKRTATKGGGNTWTPDQNNCQHFIRSVIGALCMSDHSFMDFLEKGFQHDGIVTADRTAKVVSTLGHYAGKIVAAVGPKYKVGNVGEILTQEITPLDGRVLEVRVYWNDATFMATPLISFGALAADEKSRSLAVHAAANARH